MLRRNGAMTQTTVPTGDAPRAPASTATPLPARGRLGRLALQGVRRRHPRRGRAVLRQRRAGCRFRRAALHDVEQHGAAVLGLAVACWCCWGSGRARTADRSHPKSADVSFLLLAPVPRTEVLRPLAVRQLRGVVLVPAVGGAVAGSIASSPLGGERVEWLLAGRGVRRAGVVGSLGIGVGGVRAYDCGRVTPTSSARRSWCGQPSTWSPGTPLHPLRSSGGSRCCRSRGRRSPSSGSCCRWCSRASAWPGSDTRRSNNCATGRDSWVSCDSPPPSRTCGP